MAIVMGYNGELSALSWYVAEVGLLLENVNAGSSLREGSHNTYELFRQVAILNHDLEKATGMQVL